MLNRYPNDIERATVVFSRKSWGLTRQPRPGLAGSKKEMQWRKTYMRIAGTYLC